MSRKSPPAQKLHKIVEKLVKQHGARCKSDARRGVQACARVWDFKASQLSSFEEFCLEQYVPPGKQRTLLLERLDEFHHHVTGNMGATTKVVRAGLDIADRPFSAAEKVFGAFSVSSHLSEDYRRFHIASLAQLNFGTDERSTPRKREGWAARRLGHVGREVVPAELLARMSTVQSEADRFISAYNLHLGKIDFGDSRIRFPANTVLVSHWGLRDYMMSLHGSKNALIKQRAILDLMERVVDGKVPAEVLDNPKAQWNIASARLRVNGTTKPAKGHGPLRWAKFRDIWQLHRKIDQYRLHGNLIDQKFKLERELPEEKVVGILTKILSSPVAERVGRFMRDKLGRDLEPFDIYFKDFLTDGKGKTPLKFDIRKRYPDSKALHASIGDILVRLGWKKKRAEWIASRIRVDNGRSAGHAWPPHVDHDLQLLRVRVDKKGCDELNFETFMHELGHCVEGVLTSYEMDYKVLWGVPNTAFTEGFAFTFQDKTDPILGRRLKSASDVVTVLRFWEPFEIAGPALTEIRFFHWLYKNPNATAAQMLRAVRRIGDEVWEQFYARIFGPESRGLMSVYSHMLWGDFYLAEYPMGHVIAYQIRKYLADKSLSDEMERICALGNIYPEEWMKSAVGQQISVDPLLRDAAAALKRLGY